MPCTGIAFSNVPHDPGGVDEGAGGRRIQRIGLDLRRPLCAAQAIGSRRTRRARSQAPDLTLFYPVAIGVQADPSADRVVRGVTRASQSTPANIDECDDVALVIATLFGRSALLLKLHAGGDCLGPLCRAAVKKFAAVKRLRVARTMPQARRRLGALWHTLRRSLIPAPGGNNEAPFQR